VQVFECQVQQAAQSQYTGGRDCVQLSQTRLGKTGCLLVEMERRSTEATEAIFCNITMCDEAAESISMFNLSSIQ